VKKRHGERCNVIRVQICHVQAKQDMSANSRRVIVRTMCTMRLIGDNSPAAVTKQWPSCSGAAAAVCRMHSANTPEPAAANNRPDKSGVLLSLSWATCTIASVHPCNCLENIACNNADFQLPVTGTALENSWQ
jgi:hypothetical protein